MMQVLQYLLVVCISLVPLNVQAKLPKVVENLNATVLIVAEKNKTNPLDVIIDDPIGEDGPRTTPMGLGTGVVISGDGIIITNHHVIDEADLIFVYVYAEDDSKKYTAKVLGVDPITDIAVLKFADKELPKSIASITWSDGPIVGDDIYSIGHPQGMAWTVSKGIIGNAKRFVTSPWQTMIQHDSLIMPGNSGGGLFDEEGHLVGINTIIVPSQDQTNTQAWSMGVTIADVKWSFERIMKYGKPRRPALNVTVDYNKEDNILFITPNSGSNAEKSGLKGKHQLLNVNGNKVSNYPDLFKLLKEKIDGDSITIETKVKDKIETYTFKLENWNVLDSKVKTD